MDEFLAIYNVDVSNLRSERFALIETTTPPPVQQQHRD